MTALALRIASLADLAEEEGQYSEAGALREAAEQLAEGDMTPLQFRAARLALGMNQREMAEALRLSGEATIRSWESGRRPISGPAQVAVELMLAHGKPSQ